MKKLLIMTVLLLTMTVLPVYAQLAVVDGLAGGLLLETKIEQGVYFAQQVSHMIKNVQHMATQVQHMVETTERAIQNLASAQNIHSYKDFMAWYNRQLYLERMTVDAFKNANITIGKKNYKFSDAEGILSGVKETYVDYWDKEFTEEQRREMWLGLGLTPANYAFVQPLRAKAKDIYRQNLFLSQIQNEEYQEDMGKNNEWNEKLAEDKDKETSEKMGLKQILSGILETLLRNNKKLNNIDMNIARKMELDAINAHLDETPAMAPPLSDWPEDGFKPLAK